MNIPSSVRAYHAFEKQIIEARGKRNPDLEAHLYAAQDVVWSVMTPEERNLVRVKLEAA
jgi:hypothetical protein